MKTAILTANLGKFDTPVDPVTQDVEATFYRFTDENFPPIADLPPRFQYRIPKMFGWQMFPGYDVYIWLDGSMSFTREDCVQYFLDQLGDNDMVVFKHPWRKTAKEEADHIEDHLQRGKSYITSRYKNGLHKEQLAHILGTPGYVDDELFASTAFVYRNTSRVQTALADWWLLTSRFFTVDQIAMAYALRMNGVSVTVIEDNQYKFPYLTLVSEHK
jgi:hypothetical protein